MPRLARHVAALAGWRRYAVALLLGALSVLALAPFHAWPVLLPAFTGLIWLLDGAGPLRRGFVTALVFAYGFFVAGLYWTGIAFFVEPDRFALLLPLPVLGLPLLLALFPAGGALAAEWASRRLGAAGGGRILLLAVGWTAGEALRGHLLTGFPWNLPGYAWGGSEAAMQAAALLGIYGLTLLTVAIAAMPALFGEVGGRRAAWRWCGGFAALAAALVGWGAIRLAGADAALVPGVRLRLVQPAIAQTLKWSEALRAEHFRRHLDLSVSPTATHAVWPETAIPYYVGLEPGVRQALAQLVPAGGLVLVGAPRRTPPGAPDLRIWNSLQAVDAQARIVGTYDKRHLVPFGEFLPWRGLLGRIGLESLGASALDFSAGQGARVLDLPGLPPVRPLICYEGIFADEIAPDGRRPAWLLNITNDGWFGDSIGPHQHFAMTRFRAVEQGVPLVRAANTGISAIVDPYGRVLARLGLGESGAVEGPLPQAVAPPPYARVGDWPAIVLALLFIAAAGLGRGARGGRA